MPPPLVITTNSTGDADIKNTKDWSALGEVNLLSLPLLSITPLATAADAAKEIDFSTFDSIALTSRHGADFLSACLASGLLKNNLPCYCVGQSSGQALRDAGFTNIICGTDGGAILADMMIANGDCKSVFWPSGADIAFDLTAALAPHHKAVHRHITYRGDLAAALPPTIIDALSKAKVAVILFYSARAAAHASQIFADHGLSDICAQMTAVALAPRIAAACQLISGGAIKKAAIWGNIETADAPTHAAMLAKTQSVLASLYSR